MTEYGYSGKILKVDLSLGKTGYLPTSDYSGRFLGGKGLAARLYWEMAPSEVSALEPGNCLICASGPLTGFAGLAASRWIICGKSPAHQPEAFSYGNLGGSWGCMLKSSGFDAVVVQGKASRPVYLDIRDGQAVLRDASAIWGKTTFDASDHLKKLLGEKTSVLSIGPAAENGVVFATLLADQGSSCSGGLGAVMGSKNLKAICVAGTQRPVAADSGRMHELIEKIRQIKGSALEVPSPWSVPGLTIKENCHSCGIGCSRQSYRDDKGRRFKSFCAATGVYSRPVQDYFGKWNELQLEAVRLCDGYGLDTAVMGPLISWLIDCYRRGLLSESAAGLPLSQAGGPEFIRELTRKIAFREGFGRLLAEGTIRAAESLGGEALALTSKYVSTMTGENKDYDPRLILTTALLLATEPRKPIQQLHGISGNILIMWASWARGLKDAYFNTENLRAAAERFWGGPLAVDFSTYEGKALAAKTVQDRAFAQECLVLCDLHWPMMAAYHNGTYGGDPSMESQILSAATGNRYDEGSLLSIGERVCNLQRAILVRQGWKGRSGDSLLEYFFKEPLQQGEVFFDPDGLMPGKKGEIISRVGCVLDRREFESMKSQYYELRGWGVDSGFPTRARLEKLDLRDVADDLAARHLLG